ncbi:MAG: DUF3604 domain-containing protein [Deltaproteobacteria bacterium]
MAQTFFSNPTRAAVLVLLATLFAVTPAIAADITLRIRFGFGDRAPADWSGSIRVEPGRVGAMHGWSFRGRDRILAGGRFTLRTRKPTPPRLGQAVAGAQLNGIGVALHDVDEDSLIRIETAQGIAEFRLGDLPAHGPQAALGGRMRIERMPNHRRIAATEADEDFTALATAPDGSLWVGWIAFTHADARSGRISRYRYPPKDFSALERREGADQAWVRRRDPAGDWQVPIAITAPARALSGLTLAVDGDGVLWAFWSERRGESIDLLGRPLGEDPDATKPRLLGRRGENDLACVAATDASGRIWLAWQGIRNGRLTILLRRQQADGSFLAEQIIDDGDGSSWAPAIAATASGENPARVAIAWDTYRSGDYDVRLRLFDSGGSAGEVRAVASSPAFEARPLLAWAPDGNLWVAWRYAAAHWGKDRGYQIPGDGAGLYESRSIAVRVLAADGSWQAPLQQPIQALGAINPPDARRAEPGRGALPPPPVLGRPLPGIGSPFHILAALVIDEHARPWIISLSRDPHEFNGSGFIFDAWATVYDERAWSTPILLPRSDGYRFPPVRSAAQPSRRLVVATSGDSRRERQPASLQARSGPVALHLTDTLDADILVWELDVPPATAAPFLQAAIAPAETKLPTAATLAEREDVRRLRAVRIEFAGEELRISRGDLHRHTEFSSDGGLDGTLDDLMRYAIDAGRLDFVVNSDHSNGNHREFPWWLTQKAIDDYTFSPSFTGLHGHERSAPFPEGHRNILFRQRGIRPLPRLPIAKIKDKGPAADTEMLYSYLRAFDGLAFPHTTATRMGTDWRNHDPEREPMVEVYQGARQSSERAGAPRAVSARNSVGQFRPKGMINHALNRGYHFSFYASSDHLSTHVSYAMVWTPSLARGAIFESIRKGRVYGATDNIFADFRIHAGETEGFLGEEIEVRSDPTYRVRLHGTAPFARVVFIHDDKIVHELKPGTAVVDASWTDTELAPGQTSWTYVRGEQEDGELVWASPIFTTRVE